MDLGFIINTLPKAEGNSPEVRVAQGEYKIITNWKEAKRQILWQLRRK